MIDLIVAIIFCVLLFRRSHEWNSKKDNESHSLFFYKTEKGVGAVDRSGAYGIYKNIDDLIKDYNTENNQDYEFSAVIDLDRTYPDKRWMFGDKPISVYK